MIFGGWPQGCSPGLHSGCGPADADLRGGDPPALGEVVDLGDVVRPANSSSVMRSASSRSAGRLKERGHFAQDAGAALDDSKVTHALAGP